MKTKPPKLQPALLGGLFIGVVSALPFVGALNGCCCLWLITGGVLAAYLMQQNHPDPISLLDGTVGGLFAGLFGIVVLVGATAALSALQVVSPSEGFREIATTQDPEVAEMLRRIDPSVLAVIGATLFAFVGIIASAVGGTIGAALFRRSAPPPPPDLPPGWGLPPAGGAPMPPNLPPVPWTPTPPTIGDELGTARPSSGEPGAGESTPGDSSPGEPRSGEPGRTEPGSGRPGPDDQSS